MNSSASARPLVIAAVMTTMAMIAIESTIVSTAMPQIVADIGGLEYYSWVFSSFLLTQTAMTVVFGSLADIFGRKPIMFVGIAVFLLGSLLAGFAHSMTVMVVCRLVQGIGAGAIQPVAMTIVADLYPARERGKVQGYLASVWAVAAVVGPILGGLIIRTVSWGWVFWINIPVGIAAAAGFWLYLRETPQHRRRSVDWGGALTFTVAVSSLLIALTELGNHRWSNALMAMAVCGSASAIFYAVERRAAHPIVSFGLWSHRPVAATNGVSVLANMSLIGLTSFLPIYVQVVMSRSPTTAGLTLTTMLIGWPVAATLSSRLFHRMSLRTMLIAGALFQPLGAIAFVAMTPGASPLLPALGSLVMGFGMGLISLPSLVLLQEMVEWTERGAVTASNIFSRNMGSTLGATLLGAILNHGMQSAGVPASVTSDRLRLLLTDANLGAQGAAIRTSLSHSLGLVFEVMLALAVVTAAIAFLVPRNSAAPAVRDRSAEVAAAIED